MLRLPLSIVSPSGPRGRLSILAYHRVVKQPDPLFPELLSAAEFEERMRWVAEWFNVLPLMQGVSRLFNGTLPARALAITFDDGYADNEELAAPILKRLGLTATFFVATGFLDGGWMFNDRVIEAIRGCRESQLDLTSIGLKVYPMGSMSARQHAIASVLSGIKYLEPARRQDAAEAIAAAAGASMLPRLMMRQDQVRSLRAQGMHVGAHTVSHPILTSLPPRLAMQEMLHSKNELERILNAPVELFAYPNGTPGRDYTAEHARMARECGFSAAVSGACGAATSQSDRHQLPRFTPWDRSRLSFGVRMLANYRHRAIEAT